MKKLIYTMVVVAIATACNTTTSTSTKKDSTRKAIHVEQVSPRDQSITTANAYNNLFIDSSTVANYITANNIPLEEVNDILSFYNARNYQYAWFNNNGITEEGRNFWNAYTYEKEEGKDTGYSKKLMIMMDTLLPSMDTISITAGNKAFSKAEIAITRKFLEYYYNNANDNGADKTALLQLLPTKKMDVFATADLLLDDKQKALDDNVQRQYNALKKQLSNYVKLAKNQPADSIVVTGKLKKGTNAPVITVIKRRLQEMGYLPAIDTSSVFTDTLETAVRSYQLSLGTKDDGIISASLVKQLSIPLKRRVAQLVVNMNRLAWMPGNFSDNYIQVNIPEFMLHVYEGKSKVFDMPVVVGREGTSTMMFAGDMNQVVFSPYWNVPESIVKKEIVPGMAKNANYIENHHMEITGTRNDLPVVRQLPGEDNSLGKVKFLFPNSYDIYLHDTNAKYLFDKEKRAFSHGCIRLADAEKMANYVLRNDSSWTPEKITEAMNSDTEKFVRIKNPLPVLISYLTAWVDENGKLNFREDIYGHDEAAAAKLFTGL
ncbi:hypothetical protein BH10BAC3_BH10BAC3_41610 [soil metagenome]